MKPRLAKFFLIGFSVLCSACSGSSSGPAPAAATPAAATPAAAPLPAAAVLIKRAATQDGARDSSAELRMTVEESGGKRQQMEVQLQRKYTAERVSTFLKVVAPKEEADKALLAIERPEQATEAFSYLAGLKKLARLSSNSTLGFAGTRVSVQELLGLELGQYTHDAGERVSEDGAALIKIEFKQKPERGLAFPRILGFFRESEQSPARFELYNTSGAVQKTMRVTEVKPISNYQTITRVQIEDQQGRKVQLETRAIKYDRGLSDKIFTEEYLKGFISNASQKLIQ